MIYYQKTMVAINRPKDKDFYWYFLDSGILDKDKYSDKEYIWSDEKLENFEYEVDDVDKFLEDVRKGEAKYLKIKKGLFSKKEKLVFDNGWNEYESWCIEDIKRIDVRFYYNKEQNMTLDEARGRLDVEEYAKMVKGLGLNSLK